jgi:hypothetical protein
MPTALQVWDEFTHAGQPLQSEPRFGGGVSPRVPQIAISAAK